MKTYLGTHPILRFLFLIGVCSLIVAPAQAHTGHAHAGSGFSYGFGHPFGGWDHLLAMVAVGMWAFQLSHQRSIWILPLTFVATMIAGMLAGLLVPGFPFLEAGILLSVFALGAFLVASFRPGILVGACLVAFFALFHGYAHGAEMPASASGMLYGAGMLVATGLLHFGGVLLGKALSLPGTQWIRAGGVAVLVTGLVFFVLG